MKPITDWCKHKAVFFDAGGHPVGIKKIKYHQPLVEYKNRTYNFLPKQASFFKLRFITHSCKYYFYTLDNPMPLKFENQPVPVVDSEAYKRIMHTDLIKKLNDLQKSGLAALLSDPKVIFFIIIVIVAIYYFARGGTLT